MTDAGRELDVFIRRRRQLREERCMRMWVGVPVLALAFGGCADAPTAPESLLRPAERTLQEARPDRGTGLALESFTQGLPLVGDVQVTEVVITEFSNFLGGLQASGTITGTTVNALGETITVTEDFTTDVLVSSSGGGCDIVTIDLGPIGADVFGTVGVDIPVANVSGKGSGAVGSLLCAVSRVVNGVAGAALGGLINALNNLLS
jgi:hypothetical protein